MLTVKIETCHSTFNHKIFEIVACNAVRPIVAHGGEMIGVALEIYGADNQTGQSYEKTVKFNIHEPSKVYEMDKDNLDDDKPIAVYVENSFGKTICAYMRQGLRQPKRSVK